MIPIKYFWSEHPTDEEIHEAMKLVKNENCVVIIKWSVYIYQYSMVIKKGMTFEECHSQIPNVYGL